MSTQLVMLSKVLQRYNGLKLLISLKSPTPPILTSKLIIANTPRLFGIGSNANFPKQISLAQKSEFPNYDPGATPLQAQHSVSHCLAWV